MGKWVMALMVGMLGMATVSDLASAIDVKLDDGGVKKAVEAGKQIKDLKSMPTPRFGADLAKDLCGGGGEIWTKTFVLERLGAMISADPERYEREKAQAQEAIEKAGQSKNLKIVFDFCGDTADFAEDAQATLEQDGRMIKGEMAKPDKAKKNTEGPAYRGKVAASFPYGSFDPKAVTKITLYPKTGDAMSWEVDLSKIQ